MKKLRSKVLLIFLVSMLVLTGCGSEESKEEAVVKDGELIKTDSMELKYASGFKVDYYEGGYKIITDSGDRKVLLVPEGKEAPELDEEMLVLQQPIESLGLTSTVQASWFRPIEEVDRITVVSNELEKWAIPEMKKQIEEGKATFVGATTSPDFELLKEIDPSLMLVSPSFKDELADKYDELDLKYIMIGPHLENDPIARLEWVKFGGALFDKEDIAAKFFDEELAKIEATKAKAEEIKEEDRPTVATAYFSTANEIFNMKNAGDYQITMMRDSGSRYFNEEFYPEESGGTKISAEEFYAQVENADILIYDNISGRSITTIDDLASKGSFLRDIKSVKENSVWGVSDDYWQAADQVAKMYEELYLIFTGQAGKGEELHFYYNMD